MPVTRISARLSLKPRLSDYALALGLAGAALLCRAGLEAVAPGIAYFVVLLPAVVVAGVFLGTGPAVMTAAAGGVAISAVFLHTALLAWPPFNPTQLDTLVFLPACATVLAATSALRRAAAGAAAAEGRLAEVFRQIPGAAAFSKRRRDGSSCAAHSPTRSCINLSVL